jgi:hypothetical protein
VVDKTTGAFIGASANTNAYNYGENTFGGIISVGSTNFYYARKISSTFLNINRVIPSTSGVSITSTSLSYTALEYAKLLSLGSTYLIAAIDGANMTLKIYNDSSFSPTATASFAAADFYDVTYDSATGRIYVAFTDGTNDFIKAYSSDLATTSASTAIASASGLMTSGFWNMK